MSNQPTSETDLYYLQDKRSYVGNSMLWWAVNGAGYTCDIRKAHVYSKDGAYAQNKVRSTDVPWRKDYIENRISHHIDMQHCMRDAIGAT